MKDNLILGAILAEGTSRRMQKSAATKTDKCFSLLTGKPLIEHVIARAHNQVDSLVINGSNMEPRFTPYQLPIISDCFLADPSTSDEISDRHLGPLAGVASILRWARTENTVNNCNYQWLATFPCDTPFVPSTLVSHLLKEVKKNKVKVACASSQGKVSPLCGLWSVDVLSDLIVFLEEGNRKVMQFLDSIEHVKVDFKPQPLEEIESFAFYNINTPEQLEEAQRIDSRINE